MKGVLMALGLVALVAGTAAAEWVNGYIRRDGTYVNGYYRTERDNNPYNNMSYPGNYNINTGRISTGNEETYINKYYQPNTSWQSKYSDDRQDYLNYLNGR